MTTGIFALTAPQEAEVRAILDRLLPPGTRTYVFGSRAGGKVKPWSDLDLAFEGEEKLSIAVLARLAQAFDDSDLPWKVDLVDLNSVSADFRRMVDATKVALE